MKNIKTNFIGKVWQMISFKTFLGEAVEVDTSTFYRSHTKQPTGRGSWLFTRDGVQNTLDFSKHKEGEDWFQHNGTYAEAKRKAKEWAKTKGRTFIHVVP